MKQELTKVIETALLNGNNDADGLVFIGYQDLHCKNHIVEKYKA